MGNVAPEAGSFSVGLLIGVLRDVVYRPFLLAVVGGFNAQIHLIACRFGRPVLDTRYRAGTDVSSSDAGDKTRLSLERSHDSVV